MCGQSQLSGLADKRLPLRSFADALLLVESFGWKASGGTLGDGGVTWLGSSPQEVLNAPPPKVALVTGSARGIGRAIALQLARQGVDIAVGDRRLRPFAGERYYRLRERRSGDDESIAAADAVRSLGRRACEVEFDVADHVACNDAVQQITDALGPIDILVNAAGIVNNIAPLPAMSRASWDHELAVNLSGAFSLIQLVVPGMAERGWGRIVNIASVGCCQAWPIRPPTLRARRGCWG